VVWRAALLVSARPEGGAGAVASSPQHALRCCDADRRRGGLVAQERKQQTGALVADAIKATAVTESTAAAATDVMDRVAGMIKKAVDRSSGRRFRGEDGQTPAIKTAAADLPLDVLRSMDIRVDPWSAPPCAARTPCGFSRRLRTHQHQLRSRRMRPANAKTSGAHVSRGDVPTYDGAGPVPPDCHARSHMQHRLLHLRARRFEDSVKIAPRRVG
jgi:hypothetical protein